MIFGDFEREKTQTSHDLIMLIFNRDMESRHNVTEGRYMMVLKIEGRFVVISHNLWEVVIICPK